MMLAIPYQRSYKIQYCSGVNTKTDQKSQCEDADHDPPRPDARVQVFDRSSRALRLGATGKKKSHQAGRDEPAHDSFYKPHHLAIDGKIHACCKAQSASRALLKNDSLVSPGDPNAGSSGGPKATRLMKGT